MIVMASIEETSTSVDAASRGLRRDAIGLREVLFQSITDMAPGAAIAASIPTGAAYASGALPLSVALALVACLLTAACIAMLARHLPSAGSLATYSARGLHPAAGFLVAWGYVLSGVLVCPLVLLQLGYTFATQVNHQPTSATAAPNLSYWWVWSLAGAVIVLLAGYFGIRTSARLGTALGAFEIAVFLVLAVFFIVHAGHHNTFAVFGTRYTPAGYRGVTGVIAGSVYSVLAFGGFEAAAPLAEEARNPRRTVPLAIMLATLGIGILYVFTTYAVDVAYGPGKFGTFSTAGSSSWQGLAQSLYGLFWVFVFLAIINSTIANANAGTNVASRTGFAMGRIGVFPSALSIVHPRWRSPVVGIFVTFALTVAVLLGLGLHYNPINAFAMVATGLVIILVGAYILTNAACIGYFWRSPGGRRNWLLHVVVPLLGIAAFVPAWLTAAGIRAFSFVAPLTAPSSYMGPGVAGWMFAGLLYLGYLYWKHPSRIPEVGQIHID
jgi:amino acid transporter